MSLPKPKHITKSGVNTVNFPVTPSDTTKLSKMAQMLYIGQGGDVNVVAQDGSEAIWKNVPTGGYIVVNTIKVKASGTTAQDIIGLA